MEPYSVHLGYMAMSIFVHTKSGKKRGGEARMAGRGKSDKSERRNNHPAGKPSSLEQFGSDLRGKKMAQSPNIIEDPSGNK
jgi:hypothetical protein